MKIDRLLAIVMILLNKRRVTAKELAEYFEVSIRTIQRDLEAITLAGIPIISYQGHNGGYSIIDTYKIDANFFTSNEFNLLIASLKGLDKLLGKKVNPILDKIGTLHKDTQSNAILMDFSSWGMNSKTPQKIHTLHESIETNKIVRFVYRDMNGQCSDRTIEPLKLVLKLNAWYVYGYCVLRQDYRLFKVTRMEQLTITRETFIKRPIPHDFLDEMNSKETDIRLKLKFNKKVSSHVYDMFDMNYITQLKDSLIVDVAFREDEWVYGMILSYGDNVEVLEPEHIKEIIVNRARKLIKLYE